MIMVSRFPINLQIALTVTMQVKKDLFAHINGVFTQCSCCAQYLPIMYYLTTQNYCPAFTLNMCIDLAFHGLLLLAPFNYLITFGYLRATIISNANDVACVSKMPY